METEHFAPQSVPLLAEEHPAAVASIVGYGGAVGENEFVSARWGIFHCFGIGRIQIGKGETISVAVKGEVAAVDWQAQNFGIVLTYQLMPDGGGAFAVDVVIAGDDHDRLGEVFAEDIE